MTISSQIGRWKVDPLGRVGRGHVGEPQAGRATRAARGRVCRDYYFARQGIQDGGRVAGTAAPFHAEITGRNPAYTTTGMGWDAAAIRRDKPGETGAFIHQGQPGDETWVAGAGPRAARRLQASCPKPARRHTLSIAFARLRSFVCADLLGLLSLHARNFSRKQHPCPEGHWADLVQSGMHTKLDRNSPTITRGAA